MKESDQLRAELAEVTRQRDEAKKWANKCERSQAAWQERHAQELEQSDKLRADLAASRARVEELEKGMEIAWGVIANAAHGNWEVESAEWRKAAENWRDNHWHKMLSTKGGEEVQMENVHIETSEESSSPTLTAATPETDDERLNGPAHEAWSQVAARMEKKAKELERQRDTARSEARTWHETADSHYAQLKEIQKVLGEGLGDMCNRADFAKLVVERFRELVKARENTNKDIKEFNEACALVENFPPLMRLPSVIKLLLDERDTALADAAQLREALEEIKGLGDPARGSFRLSDEAADIAIRALSSPTSDRLRELEKDRERWAKFEKFIWSSEFNYLIIAPYRIGKTDEMRVAIFGHDDAPLDNEIADGSTFSEAIDAAMTKTARKENQ